MISRNQYYDKLLYYISKRKQFKSFSGSEGIAYFVSPKLVLKEYTKSDDWDLFNELFDAYCSEVQQFSNSGKSIAKVYAWERVPNIAHYVKGEKNAFQYFILEERVPGRELYVGYLEDAYSLVSDLCSEEEFKKALKSDGSKSLYKEIVSRFVGDYVQMNEFLESLIDDELSKFLEDAYVMYKTGKVSYPDLFPHNILTDKKSLKMIDMHLKDNENILPPEKVDSNFIRDVSGLFLYNCFPNKTEDLLDRKTESGDIDIISKKNRELSKRLISRMFALSNLVCDKPFVNKKDFSIIDDSLSLMFDDSDRVEIEKGINLE